MSSPAAEARHAPSASDSRGDRSIADLGILVPLATASSLSTAWMLERSCWRPPAGGRAGAYFAFRSRYNLEGSDSRSRRAAVSSGGHPRAGLEIAASSCSFDRQCRGLARTPVHQAGRARRCNSGRMLLIITATDSSPILHRLPGDARFALATHPGGGAFAVVAWRGQGALRVRSGAADRGPRCRGRRGSTASVGAGVRDPVDFALPKGPFRNALFLLVIPQLPLTFGMRWWP